MTLLVLMVGTYTEYVRNCLASWETGEACYGTFLFRLRQAQWISRKPRRVVGTDHECVIHTGMNDVIALNVIFEEEIIRW